MPTDVSSMQPRKVLKPRAVRSLEHPLGRADAAALGELDVDPGHDADQRSRSSGSTQLSSATIGSDERSWSQPS